MGQLVEMMIDYILISLEKKLIDGTKIETTARKYRFVLKKAMEKINRDFRAR